MNSNNLYKFKKESEIAVINLSTKNDLKLYTVYSPPQHKDGIIHKTKKGDTLSQITKNHYGFATQPYWKLIQDANKDLIKDANLIYPGQVFKIPELPEAMKKK
jgi:nucleoid-associated protein YgaU